MKDMFSLLWHFIEVLNDWLLAKHRTKDGLSAMFEALATDFSGIFSKLREQLAII